MTKGPMKSATEPRRWPVVVVLAVLVLLAGACASDQDDGTSAAGSEDGDSETADDSGAEETADGDASQGGTLTIMAGGPQDTWDPATAGHTIPGLEADRFNAIYGTLFHVGPDGEIEYGIAEEISSNDDFTTWTLSLREDVTFTDGSTFDAEAVKYNWDRMASEEVASPSDSLAQSMTTEVVDETTLEITLDESDPTLPQQVAETMTYIASPDSLEAQGDQYTDPVGAGPFMFESQDQGVSETVVANPDYFRDDRPYLDEIVWRSVQDPSQRVQTVVQGGAGYMNGYFFQFANEAENPAVDTFDVPAGGIRNFIFNTEEEPFDDIRARRAVALAVDHTELVSSLTQLPDDEGWRALFPEDSPYYDPELTLPEQDVEAAQDLVDELIDDGVSMEFRIVSAGVPELDRAAQVLQSSLNELDGVDASIDPVALADWRERTEQGNFEITLYPGIFDLNPPEIAMTALLDSGGNDNRAGYSSDEMDEALAAARRAESQEERVDALAEVQRIYTEDIPLVVFGVDYRSFFHREEVGGFHPIGRGTMLMEELYLEEG